MMKSLIVAFVGLFLVASTAMGQAAPEPEKSPLTLSVGGTFSNAYFFRGMPQLKDQGVIEANVGLSYDLLKGSDHGVFNGTALVGDAKTVFATDNQATNSDESWFYEINGSVGLQSDLFDRLFTLRTTYNVYNSPSNSFKTTQEISTTVQFNDGRFWKGKVDDFAPQFTGFRPYVMFANELDETRGFGSDSGQYLEIGVRPGVTIYKEVALTFPVRAGWGLDDYYGDGSQYGYFGVGSQIVIPMAHNLYFKGGVEFQFDSSDLQDRTGNGNMETIAGIGLEWRI